jgi:hypothetical protein
MRSRQPMRQGMTGMWSTSQSTHERRTGRVDRKRRRSFNIPIVRAKFTSFAFLQVRLESLTYLFIQSVGEADNFDNTSCWQILQ